jgi:4-hydroxy-3-methylbut-2-en-1-yl diphosphate synthase IspG/GcpE
MNVAVTVKFSALNAPSVTRLKYSEWLLIVDADTMEYKIMINPLMIFQEPQKVENLILELSEEDVGVILAENCESSLSKSLGTKGIQVIEGMHGSALNEVQKLKEMCMADTIVMPVEKIVR